MKEAMKQWILDHQDEMIRDLTEIIAIPSVSCAPKESPDPQKPFGDACYQAVMKSLELGERYGFKVENLGNRWARIEYSEPKGEDIGIWFHVDVVPAAEQPGWVQEDPFKLWVTENGYLVGRGITDCKGPAIVSLYALRCLKELGIEVPQGLSLYFGASEETGLQDLDWFLQSGNRIPAWNWVGDAGWPVCVGQKGSMQLRFQGETGFEGDVKFAQASLIDNAVPPEAHVIYGSHSFDTAALEAAGLTVEQTEEGTKIMGHGVAAHTMAPENGKSAIAALAAVLAAQEGQSEHDRALWQQIADMSGDFSGAPVGIAISDARSGALVCVATRLAVDENKRPSLQCNVRLPISGVLEQLEAQLHATGAEKGWKVTVLKKSPPHMVPEGSPKTAFLKECYEEATGIKAWEMILPGGNYCCKLPNSIGYGAGVRPDPGMYEFLGKTAGRGHGPNECTRILDLQNSAFIYAHTLKRYAENA